jgi:hypothetical protein
MSLVRHIAAIGGRSRLYVSLVFVDASTTVSQQPAFCIVQTCRMSKDHDTDTMEQYMTRRELRRLPKFWSRGAVLTSSRPQRGRRIIVWQSNKKPPIRLEGLYLRQSCIATTTPKPGQPVLLD